MCLKSRVPCWMSFWIARDSAAASLFKFAQKSASSHHLRRLGLALCIGEGLSNRRFVRWWPAGTPPAKVSPVLESG